MFLSYIMLSLLACTLGHFQVCLIFADETSIAGGSLIIINMSHMLFRLFLNHLL